jgi:phosphate:Na+ symporter
METSPLVFVLNMAGAAALLIWAVRLVRTGFDRAFGGRLRLWLRRSTSNRLAAATSGLGVAVLLQSSTAVAMLMAGFVSAGAIGSAAGLAIVLGADLGSALVALLLTTRLAVVTPVLLLLGVLIFLRGRQRRLRQIGRILIGMALIFLSLDLIRAASVPLVGAEGARTALLYLATDPLTAFVLAALFAWLVHSSVAAVLLFATLATQGALPPMAAFAMVLGANLGGAAIAVVLTLRSDGTVRRVTWANLVLRGGSALVVLWLVAAGRLPLHLLPADPGVQALTLHLAFNAALVAICLPLVGPICRLAAVLVPDPPASGDADASRTALDPAAQLHPKRAFACAVRELVDMGSRIEGMVRQVPGLFSSFDETAAAALRDTLEQVQRRSLGSASIWRGSRDRTATRRSRRAPSTSRPSP